jgi:hypothetical protein
MSLMMGIVLANITTLKLPNRPGRIEPRAKKRRPKLLPLLTVPAPHRTRSNSSKTKNEKTGTDHGF